MKRVLSVFLTVVVGCCQSLFAQDELKASARTISITPKVGTPAGHSRSGNKIEAVYGDLKTTIVLMEHGNNRLCFFTSALGIERGDLHDASVSILSKALKIAPEAIIASSSHNHTIPMLYVDSARIPDKKEPHYMCWELGQDYLAKLRKAAGELAGALQPVSIEWGVAEENRITYNRKGRRINGESYFIREEDRFLEGEGYVGVIDPQAVVVVMKNKAAKPIAAFSFFTGHPVAAYNPEKMISYGQFPQVASDKLSGYLGGIPVAFLQGCAGNINCKHMLTGTIEQARVLGEQLGDTFIIAAKSLRKSKRTGLEWSREIVHIPFTELPSQSSLQKDLDSIDDFIKRGKAGDQNTLECVGMNFPKALTPPYRANLIQAVRPWYVWALEQHKTGNLKNIPSQMPMEISVARFGDVGFVGLPYEPFVETGLKIKREAALPIVLTTGYTDGSYGYIPDEAGVNDREYMSGNYRYRGSFGIFRDWKDKKESVPYADYIAREFTPPYAAPAGDACANAAILTIGKFAR